MRKNLIRILFVTLLALSLVCLASCAVMDLISPKPQHTVCVDINKDSICDTCGKAMPVAECKEHRDTDGDGQCDKCDAAVLRNMTGIIFSDAEFTYDGEEHTIAVAGAPAGAAVTYDVANVQKDAGEYEITATVTCEGYNPYTATATLTINAKVITIKWGDNSEAFPANGKAPELQYTLTGVVEGDEVEVGFDFGDYDFIEQGTVEVTAISLNPNYKIRAKEAKTEIVMGPNIHTVTFDTGIEDKTVDPQRVLDGDSITAPRAPSRAGYDLIGWYNGDQEWDFSAPVTESMNLTANWKAVEYTITYNLHGGINAESNPTAYTIETGADISAPTRDGPGR